MAPWQDNSSLSRVAVKSPNLRTITFYIFWNPNTTIKASQGGFTGTRAIDNQFSLHDQFCKARKKIRRVCDKK